MGLDITAYRKISLVDCVFDSFGNPIDPTTRELIPNCFKAYVNNAPEFKGRANGIEAGTVYKYSDSFRFHAGSYGGYNEWREELAKMAGWPTAESDRHGKKVQRYDEAAWQSDGGLFWELIHFSDCEGILGTAVCQKLAKEFSDWEKNAKAHDPSNGWFIEKYTKWKQAFEMAADGGCIAFH